MTSVIVRVALAAGMAMAGTAVWAQEQSTNQVASKTDWSVFVENNPKECWSVSAPKETVNTDSSGRIKAVRRGDILLFVFFRPEADVSAQVTFTGGYPFADGSNVTMEIGDSSFELLTDGEWAWPEPTADASIVAAMKRGAEAKLTARSARGTITKDTFSLLGFTAALDEAAARCK